MARYFHPPTGRICKAAQHPGQPWEDIMVFRYVYRTLNGSQGWWWHSFGWREQLMAENIRGWERVIPEDQPVPREFHVGGRTRIRFGFAPLSTSERKSFDAAVPAVAVVLPDEPGLIAAANCPGARYGFSCGMLTEGVTAPYLIEKLLHYRVSKLRIPSGEAAWMVLSGDSKNRLDAWSRDALDRLHCLADELSYDLRDAALREFGEGLANPGLSKPKTLQLRRARNAMN